MKNRPFFLNYVGMNSGDDKKQAFEAELAREVAINQEAISEIFRKSKVGQCGKCKGFQEEDLSNLCDQCLKALEEESDEIFSVSPKLRLLGDVMNTKS